MVPHRMVAWNGWNTAICWGLPRGRRQPRLHAALPRGRARGRSSSRSSRRAGRSSSTPGSTRPRSGRRSRARAVHGRPRRADDLEDAPRAPVVRGADLSSIRWLISGGAPLPLYLIEAYQRRGIVFKQGYGLTEVGVNCFAMSVEESVAKKGSIGRPLMMTDAKLVDEAGREVPVGEVGELCLRGPARLEGLLAEPRRDGRRARRRRLLPHGRPRPEGRGRLLHDRRAPEGHAHLRRRQRLPGRDRGGAPPPPGGPGRRRRRRPRPDLGRGRRRVRRGAAGRGRRRRRSSSPSPRRASRATSSRRRSSSSTLSPGRRTARS